MRLKRSDVSSCLAVIYAIGSAPLLADDNFPIAGSYVENQACHRDIAAPRVKITPTMIESNLGRCFILNKRLTGQAIAAQIQCRTAGGEIIVGDVTFTIREDATVAISDQDNVYSAILHKCPD
jgi:hypothetical protein